MMKLKFLVVLATVFLYTLTCLALETKTLSVSLSLNNESLQVMTETILEQTGYTLLFPDNFHSMKVSGEFKDISIDELLSRVLKGINHSIVFVEDDHLLIVKLFGAPKDIEEAVVTKGKSGSTSPEEYYDELLRIGKNNEKDYQDYMNNPSSIDPRTGLTLGELKEKAKADEMAIEKIFNDDNSIDPSSGLAMGQLRDISEANEAELQAYMSNPQSIDPMTGRSMQELRKIGLKNQLQLDQNPPRLDF